MPNQSRLRRKLTKGKFRKLARVLRGYDLLECLYVCHAYISFLQSDNGLPGDVERPPFEVERGIDLRSRGLCEWRLETLIGEAMLFAENSSENSLRSWNELAVVMNSVGKTHNALHSSGRDIWISMMLTVAQQHHWQVGVSNRMVCRYLGLLQHPRVSPHILATYECSPEILVRAAYGLYSHFSVTLDAPEQLGFESIGIDPTLGQSIVNRVSADQVDLTERISASRTFDERMIYGMSPLLVTPIIRYQNSNRLLCPIPYYLFKRILEGAYFDCLHRDGFGNDYGQAFEDYVFEFLNRVSDPNSTKLQRDVPYGTPQRSKRSTDVVFSTQRSTYFIECKVKKMPMAIRDASASFDEIKREVDKIVDATVQAYRSLNDLEHGEYEVEVDVHDRKFIVILTLEKWHLFGRSITDYFDTELRTKLENKCIDTTLLERAPFRLLSCDEFELASYTVLKTENDDFFDDVVADKRWYEPTPTFTRAFAAAGLTYDNPFEEELNAVLNI